MNPEENVEAILLRLRRLLPELRERYTVDTLEVSGFRVRLTHDESLRTPIPGVNWVNWAVGAGS